LQRQSDNEPVTTKLAEGARLAESAGGVSNSRCCWRGCPQVTDREQRPLGQLAKRPSCEPVSYSGIQTPKKSKPHWLKPWFQ
jgi:hypothetical protein